MFHTLQHWNIYQWSYVPPSVFEDFHDFLPCFFGLGAGLLTVTKTVASWKSFQLWSSLAQTTCNQRPPMGTVVSWSLHIGGSHNAFELPISDCTVHCAGPFWSPKLSHSVSAFALWVGLWFRYVWIRITHSTRLSNLQILELTIQCPHLSHEISDHLQLMTVKHLLHILPWPWVMGTYPRSLSCQMSRAHAAEALTWHLPRVIPTWQWYEVQHPQPSPLTVQCLKCPFLHEALGGKQT